MQPRRRLLGHGVGFLRRELWESGPFFSHRSHGLSSFTLPGALAVMDFPGTGLKAHQVVSWNLQTFSLCQFITAGETAGHSDCHCIGVGKGDAWSNTLAVLQ